MSLTDQAVEAIGMYREALLRSPCEIKEEQKKLQDTLLAIGRADTNIFYTVNKQSFIGFPESEVFDKEEYLTFRYLFESSYIVRRALVSKKRAQLETMAANLLSENSELSRQYELEYNQFSFESLAKRAALKAKSQYNGISSSKRLFAIEKACSDPKALGIEDDREWLLPSNYKKRIHQEFRKSATEIGKEWGISNKLLEFYINHIELKKTSEKLAVASAIAGGAVLAAWGLSKAFEASSQVASAVTPTAASSGVAIAGDIQGMGFPAAIHGFENLPEYVAIQSNPLTANQAAYFNHLNTLGSTNAYDVQMALINENGQMMRSLMENMTQAITSTPTYDFTPVVVNSMGKDLGLQNNMLGAATNLNVREIGENLVTITGTVSGQNVNTNIRRIGNMLNITSY